MKEIQKKEKKKNSIVQTTHMEQLSEVSFETLAIDRERIQFTSQALQSISASPNFLSYLVRTKP
jgi:hypothetical protein